MNFFLRRFVCTMCYCSCCCFCCMYRFDWSVFWSVWILALNSFRFGLVLMFFRSSCAHSKQNCNHVQALAFKATHNRFTYSAHSGDVPFQLVSPYSLLYFQFIHFIFWSDLVLYDGLHKRNCAQSILLFFKFYLKLNHIYVHSLTHSYTDILTEFASE